MGPKTQEELRRDFPKDATVFVGEVKPKKRIKTIVTLWTTINGERMRYRNVQSQKKAPNVHVGEKFAFDHTILTQCVAGVVTNIQHVVNLDNKFTTYIDVEVVERASTIDVTDEVLGELGMYYRGDLRFTTDDSAKQQRSE